MSGGAREERAASVSYRILGRVAPRALLHAGWAALVAVLVLRLEVDIGMGPLAHSLLGVALGMLLVFRTNAAYERYWEGRRRWSEIVATSRSLMRGWACHVPASERGFVPLVSSYVCALADRLRGSPLPGLERPRLDPHDACALGRSTHVPAALLLRMSSHIRARVEAGQLRPGLANALEGHLAALTEHEAACERIASSPMPTAYVTQIRQLLAVYLATLPLALVGQLGWLAVPATLVIAFGLVGIEDAGTQIEDPFGEDDNDLPLDEFCRSVRADARLLGRVGV